MKMHYILKNQTKIYLQISKIIKRAPHKYWKGNYSNISPAMDGEDI